jgi:hypothetical protein
VNADLIRRTDRALGAHPQFADPAAITARAVARARLGVAMLARRQPDAAAPLEALAGRADARRLRSAPTPSCGRGTATRRLTRWWTRPRPGRRLPGTGLT